MTKVIILKDLPSYFVPNAPDCATGCPIAMYRERTDDLDCNYFDYYNNNYRCPFKQEYNEEITEHMNKIIELVEEE